MLITYSKHFSGTRPTEFPLRSRSIFRPAAPIEICAVCGERAYRGDQTKQRATFRGNDHVVCGACVKRYNDPAGQIREYGFRFRFVERTELSKQQQIYKILLLLKERQEIRQKEVNWMADEMATKLLRLPDKIAAIVGKTFAVRGDDADLSDEQALIRIRDLIEEIDEKIIDRNKKKRLP